MVVLCDGMARSGSTWSFNVALKLLRTCGTRRAFGLSSEGRAVLAAGIKPRSSHLVIKSHGLDPFARELCCSNKIKVIYTWRNPYDVVVSCHRMFGLPVEHWTSVLRNSLRVWSFHRATNTAHIVSYEGLMSDPSAEITGIAGYLGLCISGEELGRIVREVSFERMKDLSEHVSGLPSSRLVRSGDSIYDRETLLHQNHIRNGGTGYGARILDERQLKAIDAVLDDEGFDFLREPRHSMEAAGWQAAVPSEFCP